MTASPKWLYPDSQLLSMMNGSLIGKSVWSEGNRFSFVQVTWERLETNSFVKGTVSIKEPSFKRENKNSRGLPYIVVMGGGSGLRRD